MHPALRLPDVLAVILEHCTVESIARAAAVCRAWEEIANGVLWRNVTCLWTFVQLLGPLEESDRGSVFSHPYSEKNWDRFLHHSQRVKELDYDYANKGQKIISPDTFIVMSTTRPCMTIVPNLTRLVWVVVEDTHFAIARLFMHMHLKKLHLIVLPEVTTTALRDFLETLPTVCPELTDLDLSASARISALEPVLSEALAALPDLEEVSFPAFGITTTVLHALSRHKHLKKVYARPFWGLGFSGAADDVKSIQVNDLPADCFPELQELDLDGGFAILHSVLAAPCTPRTLTRLYFSAFDAEPLSALRSLLDFIATELTELTFLGLAYLLKPPEPGIGGVDALLPTTPPDAIPRIPFDILRPVLRLRKLKNFHVMHNRPLLLTESDIEEMGAAWRSGPLRCLRLVPDPVFSPLAFATDMSSDLTLENLQTFARCLPDLERLEVYIDATSDIPSTPPTHVFKNLHTLDVGISPVSQVGQGAIARWLAKLVPKPGMTLLYGADWSLNWAELSFSADLEYLLPRRNFWQRIGEIHNQLCIAAEEYEKNMRSAENEKEARIKQLEAELQALRLSSQ